MGATSLSKDLKPDGVIVSILHPGHVKTDMTKKYPGGIEVEESVSDLVRRINESNIENTGKFYHAISGEELPW
jgi:short-subunit dehydrogenase